MGSWSSEPCRKRPHTDDLNEEQPLSKRLSLLNLNNWNTLNNVKSSISRRPKEPKTQHPPDEQERMEVDNVVYISDLDSESDSEPDERLVFLPDIERRLNRIPYSLVNGDQSPDLSSSTELILYSIPSSISVPEQKDVVRRAIIESRQRLRDRDAEMASNSTSQVTTPRGMSNGISDGGLSSSSDQIPNGVPGAWGGMPNGGSYGLMNGEWGIWRQLDANPDTRPPEDAEDLDAMEIG